LGSWELGSLGTDEWEVEGWVAARRKVKRMIATIIGELLLVFEPLPLFLQSTYVLTPPKQR
jgi:hypothetical protein